MTGDQVTIMPSHPRKMASLEAIADYWETAEETDRVLPDLKSRWIGWGEAFCFGCGWLAPVRRPYAPDTWKELRLGSFLERAHLVDHCIGGGGEPSNLVPLCVFCHDVMPQLCTRESALEWVAAQPNGRGSEWSLWQTFTDRYARKSSYSRGSSRTRMYRLKARFLELQLRNAKAELAELAILGGAS